MRKAISVLGVDHMPNMYGLKREALVYALKVLELSLSVKVSRLLKVVRVQLVHVRGLGRTIGGRA